MAKSFATTITRDGNLDLQCPKCKSHETAIIHTSNLFPKVEKIVCESCGYTLRRDGVSAPLVGQIAIKELLNEI